jgi:hypothetical protein
MTNTWESSPGPLIRAPLPSGRLGWRFDGGADATAANNMDTSSTKRGIEVAFGSLATARFMVAAQRSLSRRRALITTGRI